MHSTSLYGLKLSVLRGMGAKALATDHRVPLSRNFNVRTRVNKVEAKYEKPRVKEKLNEVQL